MNRFTLVLNALILILFSCKDSKSSNPKMVEEFEIVDSGIHHYIDLQENQTMVGIISSFSMMDDGGFVISATSSPKMIIYDKDGNQVKVVEATGSGPLEFNSCSLVKYYNGKIYLWSDQQLKLIIFDKEGNPIEEFKMFDRAVSDFMPYDDKMVVYTKGGFSDSFIHIYDLTSRSLILSMGEVGNEQKLLDIYECSGGLIVKNDVLCFLASDKLAIQRFDLQSMKSQQSLSISDTEFKVNRIKMNAVDLVNSNFTKVIEFIHENSVVTGIFSLDEGYVVISEVGEFELGSDKSVLNKSKRYNKYYYLNKSFDLLKIYKKKISSNESPCLIESKGNKLYKILQNEDGEGFSISELFL